MATPSNENVGPFSRVSNWFKALRDKLRSKVMEFLEEAKKLGKEDPRRVIHSLKVGLAICLVSLFYYFDPIYEGFGISAMWAVMTVVVVFEFSVGATLGRGVNRSVATFVAGGLAVGAHRVSSFCGETSEPLANYAKWEPRHKRFRYRHPWEQYLKIGAITRQCACRIEALNGCLDSQNLASPLVRARIEESLAKMSKDCSYALKEISLAIKTMTIWPSLANSHIANSKIAAENLKSSLKTDSWPDTDLLEIIPAVTVASLLIDVINCTEKIAESVHELASLANFKKIDSSIKQEQQIIVRQRTMQQYSSIRRPHHVITIDTAFQGPAE
ncbi:hypothetical protein HYC85_031053 [Camellia sinensis]|uniref:Aluminum-activated malate transporter n=1 Tax=Camellia sinensis TaxID=4442 RepID=A0A7J7FPP7_CAMSI|nr:hypothetical protein HYC85_031053 [Camellia sinensis]